MTDDVFRSEKYLTRVFEGGEMVASSKHEDSCQVLCGKHALYYQRDKTQCPLCDDIQERQKAKNMVIHLAWMYATRPTRVVSIEEAWKAGYYSYPMLSRIREPSFPETQAYNEWIRSGAALL